MLTQLDQLTEVLQPRRMPKSRVLLKTFQCASTALFQVLFEGAVFIMDTDYWLNAFSQYPGVELTGSRFSHLGSKIRLTRSGRPKSRLSRIKASTKAQPCSGSLKNLGSADFQLPDTQLVGITGRSLLRRERPGKLFDPAVEKSLDFLGIQLMTNTLQTLRVCARHKPFRRASKTSPSLRSCCLHIHVR